MFPIRILTILVAGLSYFAGSAIAADSLAIAKAGIQEAEDAPFVPADYQFLPGDSLYFTFQVVGFAVHTEKDQVKTMSLTYEVTTEDQQGTPLAPPVSGAIQAELSPEDKNWSPKRRLSVILPGLLAAGTYRVHLAIKDLIGETDTQQDFPFRVGGVSIQPSPTVTVENIELLRSLKDAHALEVPAFSPGDTAYIKFDIAGFKLNTKNEYRLSYDLKVLAPDGTTYVDRPNAANLYADSYYPASYVPASLAITTTAASSRGAYVVLLTIHDLIAGDTYQAKTAFSVE